MGTLLASTILANNKSNIEINHYNTFIPKEIWKDNHGVHINAHGGGVIFDPKTEQYYWFGEHKIAGDAGNKAHVGVHCYSSKDLYNWKDEGIALPVSDDPESPITKECILERPKVIYNPVTDKYVMWFHLERKGRGYLSAHSGVAIADKVTGPYQFLHAGRINPGKWPIGMPEDQKKPLDKPFDDKNHYNQGEYTLIRRDFEGGQMARDMTLFIDQDGKAYHIYSSEENNTTHIAELTPDFTAHTGKYVRIFHNRLMEAPTLFKKGDQYYFIGSGCTGWAPNAARSGVASHILGPWKELANPCQGNDANITFGGQSTYVLPVEGKKDTFIFMADEWKPNNAIDGRYIWLPIEFDGEQPILNYQKTWSLSKDQ